MGFHRYRDLDPNTLSEQGGSLRWSIPAQVRRDLGLEDGDVPAGYAVDRSTGALVLVFDEDVGVEDVIEGFEPAVSAGAD